MAAPRPAGRRPTRLVTLLGAALGGAAASFPPADMADTGDVTDTVDLLLEDVAGRAHRRVLVLDDVHELDAEPALAALRHLLRHAPDQLHVVLVSRAAPAVALDRLRLDGRLGEVRPEQLAFTATETAELLGLHDVALADDDVTALWRHTEGWAAGVRLAACTLQGERDPGRFVRSAARTKAVVSDYLLRELLDDKPEAMRQFLLCTSVADRLTPAVAELLSGDRASEDHLVTLTRSGVLRVEDASLRYHSLFGALLQSRLRRDDPELAQRLHGQLARWYLDHDLPADAQRHLRAAEDWDMLGRLLAWQWVDALLAAQPFVYRKLGVEGRRQAVVRSRQLELL